MRFARSTWSLAVSAALWLSAQGCTSTTEPAPSSGACATDCAAVAAPACQVSICSPETGKCELAPAAEGSDCDDGLFCTVDDKCLAGTCTGAPNHCGITAPNCRAVLCDETTRTCSIDRVADGVSCTSDDLCVVDATCHEGECVGERKTCHFASVLGDTGSCEVAACNAATGACEKQMSKDGTPCDTLCAYSFAASGYRIGPTCQAGVCVPAGSTGALQACDGWEDECNSASCDAAHGGCYRVPVEAGMPCATSDPCNTGTCDGAGACVKMPTNEGGACSDGIACTSNDVCTTGACLGQAPGDFIVHLNETFAGNGGGWKAEAPWEIGGAQWPQLCGNPAEDHTDSADNGLAATAIGRQVGYVPFDLAYLESPSIDVASASALSLRFFHSLDAPPPPWGEARVEVWSGAAWVAVWEYREKLASCAEGEWIKVTVDLTPYKNAALRVRFGLAAHVDDAPFFGWAIDDVAITSSSTPACE